MLGCLASNSDRRCQGHLFGVSITPLNLPDACHMSGAPCQMIVRQLSGACQMPHQTSVNFHQTSVKQVPYIHKTYTRYT